MPALSVIVQERAAARDEAHATLERLVVREQVLAGRFLDTPEDARARRQWRKCSVAREQALQAVASRSAAYLRARRSWVAGLVDRSGARR